MDSDICVIFVPDRYISPVCTGINLHIAFIIDDFPLPLSPTIPIHSPGNTEKDTSFTANDGGFWKKYPNFLLFW